MSDAFPDREMTILEHLEELRRRLIIAGIATAICFVIAAIFLTWPVMDFLTKPAGMKLFALRPTETFSTYMKVALATGAGLAMPVIILEALLFVVPALRPHERKYVFMAVPSVTVAFILGVLFGIFVVVPAAVRFLVGFGVKPSTPSGVSTSTSASSPRSSFGSGSRLRPPSLCSSSPSWVSSTRPS